MSLSGRKKRKLLKKKRVAVLSPSELFDQRSIRRIYSRYKKIPMLIGCRKGKWNNKKSKCRVGTRLACIYRGKKCVKYVPKHKRVRRNPRQEFDPRSIKTIDYYGQRSTWGCPKGKWMPKRRKCRGGLYPIRATRNNPQPAPKALGFKSERTAGGTIVYRRRIDDKWVGSARPHGGGFEVYTLNGYAGQVGKKMDIYGLIERDMTNKNPQTRRDSLRQRCETVAATLKKRRAS